MSPQTGQWADSLFALEKVHLLRLFIWAAGSVAVGTGLIALLRVRQLESTILSQFAIQSVSWGLAEIALAVSEQRDLHLRDLASAVALDRFVWLNVGLAAGLVGIGLTLAIVGIIQGRRLGFVGAGAGVMLQGVALAILHVQFAAVIVR